MLSNNKLKYFRSLHQRKQRQKYHNFIAEGEKIAHEVLSSQPNLVETIVGLPDWLSKNQDALGVLSAEIIEADPAELKKISLLNTPNQVFMVLRQPSQGSDLSEAKTDLSLFLDNIQDPGNLGTILRIADWFGIRHVFRSPGSVEAFNPKVVQSSMGAFLRILSPEIAFSELKTELSEVSTFGAVLGGESVFEMDLPQAALLVIGNESRGISPEVVDELTHQIAIPRHDRGEAESLNAAIAAGILCARFRNA